jgi:hypothetical protein
MSTKYFHGIHPPTSFPYIEKYKGKKFPYPNYIPNREFKNFKSIYYVPQNIICKNSDTYTT